MPSSRIIVFEAISSPLCPSAAEGKHPGQVPFRKFSGARIAGYNVSISSRASSRPFPWTIVPLPGHVRIVEQFFLPLIHGMSIVQQRKWIREIVGEVFSHSFVDFSFQGGGGNSVQFFSRRSCFFLFLFYLVISFFFFFFFFLLFSRIVN